MFITGAAAGLARGITISLARAGFHTAFSWRPDGTPPEATLDLVRPFDADVVAVPADFSRREAAAAAIAAVEAQRGPVEVLVHAVGPLTIRRFEHSTLADYDAMIESNLGSAVALAAAVLPGMRARGYGRLVYFAMNGSQVTEPVRGMALYGAAKAGVVTFARTLALEEAAHGIAVNVVEPGDIREKDPNRPGVLAIADAVRYLISDESGSVNGVVLPVTGGDAGSAT